MSKNSFKIRSKEYLRENCGTLFLIIFMILLIVAAGYLALGNEGFANILAEYAYYSFVIGVTLQIASYIKYERRNRSLQNEHTKKDTSQYH